MYSKLIIIGNLGSDAEMRYTADGKPVISFSVATSRYLGNEKSETTWFRCTYWPSNFAEEAQRRLTKGTRVLVEGQIRPDSETGCPKVFQKRDGSCGASYEVAVERYRTFKSEEVGA
jgi:single-strand DNA-binding protein